MSRLLLFVVMSTMVLQPFLTILTPKALAQESLDEFGGTGRFIADDFAESLDAFGGTGGNEEDIRTGQTTVTGEPTNPTNQQNDGSGTGSFRDALEANDSRSASSVYNLLVIMGGWIASLGGMAFDFSFDLFVLKFGCWFTTEADGGQCGGTAEGQVGGAVDSVWKVVRDLFNIVFIFALVFIGLRLILDADETGTRKAIGYLIAAALLVNFSLYISKLVIDVANFTAVQVYEQMMGGVTGQFGLKDAESDYNIITSGEEKSISGVFMGIIRINTFFNNESLQDSYVSAIALGLIVFIFLSFLGCILLYGAAMLIFRFIAIVFLLIFSPFMFLGWVLPQFENYAKQWRTSFLAYAMFVPAYVFLLYISLFTLIQISSTLAGEYSRVIGAEGDIEASDWAIYLLYALGIGFLIASTKIAGAMSKSGAVIGMQTGNKLVSRFTTGVGVRGAKGLGGLGGWALGRTASSAVGSSAKGLGKMWDTSQARNKNPRNRTSIALRKGLASLEDKKFGGSTSYKSRADERKEEAQRFGVASVNQKILDEVSSYESAGDNATRDQTIKMERAVSGATTSQLESLGASKLKQEAIAGSLSSSQFEAIRKSDKFNDTEKASISTARKEAIKTKLRSDNRVVFEKASTDQLTSLGSEYLSESNSRAATLSPGQLDDLKKKLTETEFQTVSEANKNGLLEKIQSNNPVDAFNKANGESKKDKDVAKMPADVLMHENAQYHLNANILKGILENETLSAAERATLKNRIENVAWNQYSPEEQAKFERFFRTPLGSNF